MHDDTWTRFQKKKNTRPNKGKMTVERQKDQKVPNQIFSKALGEIGDPQRERKAEERKPEKVDTWMDNYRKTKYKSSKDMDTP